MNDPHYVRLLMDIGSAEHTSVLRTLRDQIHERMEAMLPSLPVEQFYKQLNEAHDALVRRVIRLAEAETARLGMGSPPVPYAYLLFGSGGRKEQTLSSDQDSGIVYEDPVPGADRAAIEQYYQFLSGMVVEKLQEVGYPPCEGNVLSSNPQWCMAIGNWQNQMDGWLEDPEFEVVRYLLIIADGRVVAGDERLLERIKTRFMSDLLNKPLIARRMLENTMRHKVLLGVFGQLLKEQYGEESGSVDIKYGAYIPMVNAIRLLALQNAISETSTLERIEALYERKAIGGSERAVYRDTFRLFLQFRLMTMELMEDGMYTSNGKLAGRKLTKETKEQLKGGLRIGRKLQKHVEKQTLRKFR
ncbi:hypothetical protein IDH44_12680 [Paenibacillus sp. IB182496]|uniref:CBS domain-containing protein n=1 Tax=Paenibacillus sabuli TaxID=2772509 RepID=A0A927BTL0_9BACL|nr:DUF294 nucleotidyltransferase-like domain-containing protein [Paenibacillus sabuli]MBD2846052.1 hypothetical protein [Paenibacillus sabuli]